jgi:heptosyltransferase-1
MVRTVPLVLLVKTSSLGDIVHNLPVASDIRRVFHDVRIDWVAERAFAAVPALHSGVRNVIGCELRRWRRSLFSERTRVQWRAFARELSSTCYDAVIDTQGLLKSAIIARLANGTRYGLDWRSSREPLRLFYDKTFEVGWNMHAVERNRRLAGFALGYDVHGEPDYGIRCSPANAPWLPPSPYVVLLHGASHARKRWPEIDWVTLGSHIQGAGFSLVLPWGSEAELACARSLAVRLEAAHVAPALELSELAAVLAGAAAAIGVDTGLSHLAAALGVPVVGIYGPTDPARTGLLAATPAISMGGLGRFPTAESVVSAFDALMAAGRSNEQGR